MQKAHKLGQLDRFRDCFDENDVTDNIERLFMHRTYARVPVNFFRISLHAGADNMTLALVPDKEHAHLIARLLNENYGLRKGENIAVLPTIIRPVKSDGSTHEDESTHIDIAIT